MNLQILQQLLTDPALRLQVSRLLSNKLRADVKSFEASAQLSKRIAEIARSGSDSDAANALRAMLKEHLDFYETLVNMTLSFNQQLMERLGDLGREGGPSDAQGIMTLSAPRNATIRAPFHLENNKRTPISISFDITPFVSEDGSHLVKPEAAFDPPSMMLRPGQEVKVELVLPVAEGFRPQTSYFATVTVTGLPATQMLVRLNVMAAQAEAPPTAGTSQSAPDESAMEPPQEKRARVTLVEPSEAPPTPDATEKKAERLQKAAKPKPQRHRPRKRKKA